MKYLYILWDNAAETRGGPIMEYHNDASAVRAFTDLLKTKDTIVAQHPHDFSLLKVGAINDDTGIITAHDTPETILDGAQWNALEDQAPAFAPAPPTAAAQRAPAGLPINGR